MDRSRETEIQNETISESASASVPEDETDAAQSGCKPKSGKTAGRSSCKPFETKAKTFDDDKDDGDGVLITLPNKNRAWKKFDKHFFFQKYLFIFFLVERIFANLYCLFFPGKQKKWSQILNALLNWQKQLLIQGTIVWWLYIWKNVS